MSLLLPFAKHIPTGRTVGPDEVERGNACECECLFCAAPMQAKKGEKKVDHFAHQPKAVDDDQPCPASFERCVFWMVKRILEDGCEISLPAYKKILSDNYLNIHHECIVTKASKQPYKLSTFPDIKSAKREIEICLHIQEHPLWLNVSYSDYLPRSNKACVHISLDFVKSVYQEKKHGFRLAMKELLLDGIEAKQWLFHSHSRENKCVNDFEALRDAERQKRKNKDTAKKVEDERMRALRQHNFDNKNDPIAIEQCEQRLRELVFRAEKAYEAGNEFGWQCLSCFVVSTNRPNTCVHCGHEEFSRFDLTEENMANLYTKFYCANYGSKSLAAAIVVL